MTEVQAVLLSDVRPAFSGFSFLSLATANTPWRSEAVENVAHVHLYCVDKQVPTPAQLLSPIFALCHTLVMSRSTQDDAQSETKKHAQALDLGPLELGTFAGTCCLKQAALQEALEDCRQGHPGSDIPKTQMPPLLTPSDAAECRLVELNVRRPGPPQGVTVRPRPANPCESV